MVMNYIKNRANKDTIETEEVYPEWVSERNASLRAWQYVEEQKKTTALYIKRHHKVTDFLTQKTYKIKGSEIADALGINRTTLMNTSTYSGAFEKYLDNVNKKLEQAKDAKLKKARKAPSRGTIRNSKDELVEANKKLKDRVDELESQKTEELVRYAFDQLPLPVRKKLGID